MAEQFTVHEITHSIARTRQDLEQAFSLLNRQYVHGGFLAHRYARGSRPLLAGILPYMTVFVAKEDNKVIGAVALILDSAGGLPMDKVHKSEIDALRKQGKKVAEVSHLAVNGDLFSQNRFSMFDFNQLMVSLKLFKLLIDYGLHHERVNYFCASIPPEQQHFYTFIGFEPLTRVRNRNNIKSNNTKTRFAIAKKLNLNTFRRKLKQRKALQNIFFSAKTSQAVVKKAKKNRSSASGLALSRKNDKIKNVLEGWFK